MVGKKEPYAESIESHFSWTGNQEMVKCFLNLQNGDCYLNLIDHPLDLENITENQDLDNELQKEFTKWYHGSYTQACKCNEQHSMLH